MYIHVILILVCDNVRCSAKQWNGYGREGDALMCIPRNCHAIQGHEMIEYTYIHSYTYTHTRAHIHSYRHMHTYTHTHTHTCTDMHRHAYAHYFTAQYVRLHGVKHCSTKNCTCYMEQFFTTKRTPAME